MSKFPVILTTSKYSQRMRKLSCKIFNDFYMPELPKRDYEYGIGHQPVARWLTKWHKECSIFNWVQKVPTDLDHNYGHKYYPAHPQIRALTHILRQYGLFRDEHRDFNEAMKARAISKGKQFRERRGPIKK